MKLIEVDLFDKKEALLDRARDSIEVKINREKDASIEGRINALSHKWCKIFKIKKDDRYGYIKNALKGIILDIFYIDLAQYSVIGEIKNVFETQSNDVRNFNPKVIKSSITQFKEIFFVYYWYMAMGLGVYADDVIQSKIYNGGKRDLTPGLIREIKELAKSKANSESRSVAINNLSKIKGIYGSNNDSQRNDIQGKKT